MLPFITKAISHCHLSFLWWPTTSTSHFSLPLTVHQAENKTNQIIKILKKNYHFKMAQFFKIFIRIHFSEEDKMWRRKRVMTFFCSQNEPGHSKYFLRMLKGLLVLLLNQLLPTFIFPTLGNSSSYNIVSQGF